MIEKCNRADGALQESEERYHCVVEQASDIILLYDLETKRLLEGNLAFHKLLGYSIEDISVLSIYDIVAHDRESIDSNIEKIKEKKHCFVGQRKYRKKDGTLLDVEVSVNLFFIEGKGILCSIARDITERKQAEEALHKSEQEKTAILDGLKTVSVEYLDPQMRIVWLNSAVQKHLHLSDDELKGKRCFEIIQGLESPCPGCTALKALQTNESQEGELVTPDGKVWISHSNVIKDANGGLAGVVHVAVNISDRKRSEKALKESENKYRAIFENTGTAMVIDEDNTIISLANSEFERLAGYSREEIEGKISWTELVVKEDLERVMQQHKLRRIDPDAALRSYEFRIKDRNGLFKDILLHVDAIPGTKKSVASMLDITERKRAEVELKRIQSSIRIAMDLVKLVRWEYDVETDLFTFDDQFYALYGTTAEREGGPLMSSQDYARKFIPAEEASLVAEEISKALATTDPNFTSQVEHRIIRADGTEGFIAVRFAVVKDDKGRTIKTYGANQDITERKRAEEALKAEKDRAEQYLNIVEVILVALDTEARITLLNRKGYQVLGYEEGELIGRDWIKTCLRPQDHEAVHEVNRKIIAGKIKHFEYYEGYVLNKNGEERFVEWHTTIIKDEEGCIIGTLSSGEDITERKKAEEKILQLAAIVESSNDAIFGSLLDGTITSWNKGAERIYGYTENEIIGQTIPLLASPERLDEVPRILERLRHGEHIDHYESLCRRKDGEQFPVDLTISPIYDIKGRIIGTSSIVRDISESKKAEVALRESENMYRSIFENTGTATMIIGDNTIISLANSELERFTGYSKEEIEGKKSWTEFIVKEDLERMLEQHKLRRSDPNAALSSYEFRAIDRNGNVKGILLRVGIIPGTKKSVASLLDITERKRAYEALRDSERKLASIIEFLPDATFVVDNEKKVIAWNRAIEEMTGVSKDNMIGKGDYAYTIPFYGERRKHLLDFLDLDDNDLASKYQYVQRIGNILHAEAYTPALYGGKGAHVSATVAPLSDNEGNRIGAIESIRDITEFKNAERTLREQLNFLQQLIDSIPNPIFYKDTKGVYLGCNAAFEAITGYSKDRIVGHTVYELYPKEFADIYYETDNKLFQNPGVQIYEASMAHTDGSRHNVMFNKATYFDTEGRLAGLVGVILDITERKRMEMALQESKDYLGKIINTIGDPLFVKDRSHKFVLVNDALCNMIGKPYVDIIGRTDQDFFPKEQVEIFLEKDEEVFSTEKENVNEEQITDAQGIIHTIITKKTLYKDNTGNKFLVGIIMDITDRKQAEDKIKASLQEKELLLKEVHHRVKNNLQIISALLSLQSSYLTDEDLIKIFRDSQNRIKSMALVHENLYKSKDLGNVDFNEYINQLVSHLSQSYGDLVGKIHFKVNSENVFLNINTAIPCGMIINELVSNSLKYAFPDGRSGEICIDLSSEDDGFKLVVNDNGVGIKGDLNIKDSKTLGFRLIDTLAKQIDGKMSLDTINGTRCEIHFKGLK